MTAKRHQTHCRTPTAAYTAALIAFAGAAAAGPIPYQWALPIDGFWNDPLNWSPNGVPGLTDDVELGLTGPYTISLGPATQDAATFRITNPQAALHIVNSRSLRIRHGIVNQGQIVLNPNNEPRAPNLVLADGSTIAGSGTIRLGGPGVRAQLAGFFAADTATHLAGHTISGMGSVFLNLTNQGTITADAPGEALAFFSTSLHNEADLSAVDAGVLDIRAAMSQSDQGSTLATGPGSRVEIHGPLTLSAATTVLADGPGSSIEIHGPQVTGGSLGAAADASVRLLTSDKTLDSVRLHGDFSVQPGITVTLTDAHLDGVSMAIDPTPSAPTTIAISAGSTLDDATITLADAQHRLETTPGPDVLSFSESVTIQGRGTIEANAVNHGAIRADQPGGMLTILQSTIDHHGVLEASNGGTVVVKESIFSYAPGSSIRASGPGSIIRFEYATTGGEIVSADGGMIQFGSAPGSFRPRATLQDATLQGESEVLPQTYLTINGPLINNGTLRVRGSTSSSRYTRLEIMDGSSITGSGTLELVDGFNEIAPNGERATITLGADQTLTGSGTISVGVLIEGTVRAEEGHSIRFIETPSVSRNVIRAQGGQIIFSSTLTQEAGSRIVVEEGGSLLLEETANYPAQISNGVIDVAENASFKVRNGILKGVTINGDTLVRFRTDLTVAESFVNNGNLFLNETTSVGTTNFHFEDSMTVGGTGRITFANEIFRTRITGAAGVEVAFGPGQRLEGVATLDPKITIHGELAPGIGVGTIYANNSFSFSPSATLEIDIAPVDNDYVWSQDAHLDGTLALQFVDGFNPSNPYWSRFFMSAALSYTGAFHTVTGPDLPDPRLEYRVTYSNPYVRIGTYCKADTNSDRQLNFFDVSTYINLFNAGDPAADIAAPIGTVNFFDLSTYINRFNAGCP